MSERLYRSALHRPADRRAAFLDGACGDDSELRREVESLFAGIANTPTETFVESGVPVVLLWDLTTLRNVVVCIPFLSSDANQG